MAAPSKAFVSITDSQVDANSPVDTVLMTGLRDNGIHLEEWLGHSYTAAQDHDHNGTNSALVAGVADGAITQNKIAYIVGDIVQASANTESGPHSDATYTKKKEIRVSREGAIRVSFDMKSNVGGLIAYGRIYINGIAVGTERTTTSTSYSTYTEDFSGINNGDLVQLYVKRQAGTGTWIRNFQVKSGYYHEEATTLDT